VLRWRIVDPKLSAEGRFMLILDTLLAVIAILVGFAVVLLTLDTRLSHVAFTAGVASITRHTALGHSITVLVFFASLGALLAVVPSFQREFCVGEGNSDCSSLRDQRDQTGHSRRGKLHICLKGNFSSRRNQMAC